MVKRNICVVTGTRAEYGLLYWLMKEIEADDALRLQIIATGAHLSQEFGLTYRTIEQDGFRIDEKVEMLLSSDTAVGITKSMGVELIGFADALERLKPDIMVLLGDRYELLVAAEAALVANIPIAHIHGGEITEGAIDDAIRHCITKMSHIHFASNPEHCRRIRQLGEDPAHIHEVGIVGIDNIVRMEFLSPDELEQDLGFHLGEKFFLVTYHPVTVLGYRKQEALQNLLDALDAFPEYQVLITKSNGDAGGREINDAIDSYAASRKGRVCARMSLGQKRYLSAMKHASAVVGSSSSGLLEAPVLKKATVNIGERQKRRHREISVMDCAEDREAIISAIREALSEDFRRKLQTLEIPHADGEIAVRMRNVLRDVSLEGLFQKHFVDILSAG
ncbi:MAG: UDP-N-acetylglucosamine 2-epimerase (hydrolyzing) [Selenomonadaceae bacterium]|nr:UDP-N-acetylglucosamine 2-epimerase (hydrolyzing) [Selenomonadaceae bacterium]